MSKISGRKVRGDAKLEHLPEEQRECLHFWLGENCTYLEVARLVRDQFGVTVGKSAIGAYYRRHVLPQQQQDDAEVVAELAALPAGHFDAATLQRARALRWSALARPQAEVDRAAKLTAIIDKVERHALAVRKLALEERKVAVLEERAALRSGAAEERRAERATAEKMAAEKKKDETLETKKRGGTGGLERSAGVRGRGEDAEVAAKARSCEELSEGTGAAGVRREAGADAVVTLPAAGREEDGQELRTSNAEPRTLKEGETGMSGRGEGGAGVCPPSARSRWSPREELQEELQKDGELPDRESVNEAENLPRWPGYSGVIRPRIEATARMRGSTFAVAEANVARAVGVPPGKFPAAGKGPPGARCRTYVDGTERSLSR